MAVATVLFDIRAGIAKLSQDFANAEKRVEKGMNRIEGIMKRASAALGAYLGARAIASLVASTSAAASELADMSQRTGVAANALAGLRFAAEQSGASFQNLQRGLKNISERASEVAAGIDRYKKQYERFGISLVDASGNARQADEILKDIADRLASMPDSAAKMEAAMKLVGVEAGPRLLPMLNRGREGLEEFQREAERLGLAMGNETIRALADFDSAMNRLRIASQSTGRAIVAGFAMPLQGIAERLTEASSSAERFSAIQEKAAAIGEALLYVIDGLASVFGMLLEPIWNLLPSMNEFVLTLRTLKNSTQAGTAGFEAFAAALKLVRSAGIIVAGILDMVGKALGGIGAALLELVSGNIKKAYDILKETGRDVLAADSLHTSKLVEVWTQSSEEIVDQAQNLSTNFVGAFERIRDSSVPPSRALQRFSQVAKESANDAARAAKEAERLARTLRDNALETEIIVAQSMRQTTQVMRLELQQQLNAIRDMHADGLLSEEDYNRRREALTRMTEQRITQHLADEQRQRREAQQRALEEAAREAERAQQVGLSIGESITQGFKSAFEAESFRDVLRSIIGIFSRVASLIPGGQLAGGVSGIFAGLFAKGGLIEGPGTGTSDSILARVSRGEFVATADTVKKFGVEFFERLNEGFIDLSVLPRYAAGGMVGSAPARDPAPVIGGQAPTVYIQAFDPQSTMDALAQVWEPAQYRRGMSRQDSKTIAMMRRRISPPRTGR